MLVLSNFHLSMLPDECGLKVRRLTKEEAIELLSGNPFNESGVSNGMSVLFSGLLGIEVPPSRKGRMISLQKGNEVLFGAYRGPRFEAGATEMPEGASVTWYHILVEE